jgi:two-component system, NtrC family, response regulator AtoC
MCRAVCANEGQARAVGVRPDSRSNSVLLMSDMQSPASAGHDIPDDLLFGRTETMQELRRQVHQIGEAGLPLLIEGDSGTGKEVFARSMHTRSSRRDRLFVKINCSEWAERIPSAHTSIGSGLEGNTPSETLPLLDGSVGTILLDNIGELRPALQAVVSLFLQDPRTQGNGTGTVQVVSTTSTPLLPRVLSGSFRSDLYYRANVVTISLPPLRDRRVDIPALAQHFLKEYSARYQCTPEPLSAALIGSFLAADWPGNIRELQNAVRRYVLFGSAAPLVECEPAQANVKPTARSGDCSLKELRRSAVRECEYKAILTSLNRNQWNRRKTARELQISYRSLLYLMDQLDFPKKLDLTNRQNTDIPALS